MAASRLVVTKETRRRLQAPVRLHAPEAARRGVATDAEPSGRPCLAATQRWAKLGDLPARPGYFGVGWQPDALVAGGGHRTGGTRPANSRPVFAGRTAARHRRGAIGGPLYRSALVSLRSSGVPHTSVARWRFVPGLPRSVGLGPATGPPSLAVTTDIVLTHPAPVDLTGRVPVAQTAPAMSCRRSRRGRCLAPAKPATRLKLDAPITGHGRGRTTGCHAIAQIPTVPTMAPRIDREPAREGRVGAGPGLGVMPPGKTEIFKYPCLSVSYSEFC